MAGKNSKTRHTIQTQLRPSLPTASSEPATPEDVASEQANPDITALKLELLASLRKNIADIFKRELQETLGDTLFALKQDLQAVRTQFVNDKAASDATVSGLKGIVGEMEHALT
ncbi:hypothetical protein NFI96_008871 [Xyrichtys novacula]|uniref:Uncharacterized protein n=1 Tax=Xyrichtys novacula TaxID=13765 RepID=A0AAV1GE70_XYRNO|nr:hypothetical protein NFI96_008871 [Xyrichtys novacula]